MPSCSHSRFCQTLGVSCAGFKHVLFHLLLKSPYLLCGCDIVGWVGDTGSFCWLMGFNQCVLWLEVLGGQEEKRKASCGLNSNAVGRTLSGHLTFEPRTDTSHCCFQLKEFKHVGILHVTSFSPNSFKNNNLFDMNCKFYLIFLELSFPGIPAKPELLSFGWWFFELQHLRQMEWKRFDPRAEKPGEPPPFPFVCQH